MEVFMEEADKVKEGIVAEIVELLRK